MKTEYHDMWMMFLGDTGKTSRWSVHNRRTNACLGEIKWYGAWRSYAFFPFAAIALRLLNRWCGGMSGDKASNIVIDDLRKETKAFLSQATA